MTGGVGCGRDVVTAFLDAVSAVELAARDPQVTGEDFEALVAAREGLRGEIRRRRLAVAW